MKSSESDVVSVAHTPGPWTYHDEELKQWVLIMAGGKAGQIVANVNTESCPDIQSAPCFRKMPAEANALLIAAAPDLLEACRVAEVELRNLAEEIKPKSDGRICRACEAVHSVIAKATQKAGAK